MLIRQIEEDAKLFVERQILAGGDRLFGKMPCQRVGGIHMAGAAKTISWELVEQDHQRQ